MARHVYLGTVKCHIGVHEHTIENVCYVPTLSESVYSLFLHIKQPEHGIESSFECGLFSKFPLFQTQAVIAINDLYLDAVPLGNKNDDSVSRPSVPSSSAPVCCHITDFQKDIMHKTDHLDHLLLSLRQYYDTVKTKHQLQLEVPAGFRQESTHQKQLKSFILDQHQSVLNDSSSSSAAVNTTSAIEASICQDLVPRGEESRLLLISGVKSGVVWSKPTGRCFLRRENQGKAPLQDIVSLSVEHIAVCPRGWLKVIGAVLCLCLETLIVRPECARILLLKISFCLRAGSPYKWQRQQQRNSKIIINQHIPKFLFSLLLIPALCYHVMRYTIF
jgi:hypothetical protein